MEENNRHKTLAFGSKQIHYEISFKKRKTLGIRVHPDCSVRVIAPFDTPEEKLQRKLLEKAPWILRQQLDFLAYHPLTPPRRYVNGETHLYLGRQYRLLIEKAESNAVKLIRGRLLVFQKDKPVEKLIRQWYREKAKVQFADCLEKVWPRFKQFDLPQPELQLRTMPTRWGSCTSKGKVILNPELIKAPKGSIEYVILHELCHLVHHNHTKAFYELQERMLPDWRKWKERLENTLK